jgi:hypothetical protein
LWRRIVERAVGKRKEIGVGERHRRRQRDGEADDACPALEPAATGERLGHRLAIEVELRPAGEAPDADREVERDGGALGDADLVGADQIIELRPDRQLGAKGQAGRQAEVGEKGVAALIDIIDETADLEALRHGIAQRPRRDPGRQLPGDAGRSAGIAGILPIAVPARPRLHQKRQRDDAARFGNGGLGGETHLHRLLARRQRLGGRGRSQ